MEAGPVRESIEDYGGLAETLNTLGMIKIKHKLLLDARNIFERVVDIRRKHCSTDHAGLAQAFVSLGQAYVSLAKQEGTHAGHPQAAHPPTPTDPGVGVRSAPHTDTESAVPHIDWSMQHVRCTARCDCE